MESAPHLSAGAGGIPCPGCGYDLRGHPDQARCPECGATVHIAAALGDANRWLDFRLLDLWSIAILQIVSCVSTAFALLAMHHGQYIALILGMAAGLYVVCATLWFLAVGISAILSARRYRLRMLSRDRRRRLFRWLVVDAGLTLLALILLSAWWR